MGDSSHSPGTLALTIVNRSDTVLFRFLEKYISQLEGPVANQVWNRFMQLVKEVVAGLKDLKLQGYYTLRLSWVPGSIPAGDLPSSRCLTVLADKIVQTTAMDDRRLRKELQVTPVIRYRRIFFNELGHLGKLRETRGLLRHLCQ